MKLKLLFVLTLLSLALAPALDAKRIYSFKDENGVMHFSDSPPKDASSDVSERLVDVAPRALVTFHQEGLSDSPRFTVWNGYAGPIEVRKVMTHSVNTVTEPQLPLTIVVPGLTRTVLFQALRIDNSLAGTIEHVSSFVPGDPNATPDLNASYLLPFESELTLKIDQGFGGKYSHAESHSFHSVDIAMDVGTPVLAARAGTVMSVESDFYASGTDIAKFGDRANHIRVLHSDGTMAVYAHLALESVIVSIGDRVKAGQMIAKSGNTGFSTGPHLHFVIQRNRGGALVSIPFEFTVKGEQVTPIEGMVLGAGISLAR